MLKKNALVTATLADTEGVPVINLAHTISEKFKCTDFDKEDGAEIYTFVCEIDEAVTSMIVTEAKTFGLFAFSPSTKTYFSRLSMIMIWDMIKIRKIKKI